MTPEWLIWLLAGLIIFFGFTPMLLTVFNGWVVLIPGLCYVLAVAGRVIPPLVRDASPPTISR